MGVSKLRQEVHEAMGKYASMLEPEGWDVLDVGTAGDPPRPDGKPGGNYRFFGENNNYKTLDISEEFSPDYCGDICDTNFDGSMWDLVVVSQTLEHVEEPPAAIKEIHRIVRPKGFAIIDSPWMYPYHAEFDYDDYWRLSTANLKRLATKVGFEVIDEIQTNNLSLVLVRK